MKKILLATWNVYKGNRKLIEGLDYIFSFKPDVVSLQEFPYMFLDIMKSRFPEYKIHKTCDFFNKNIKKNTYSCLLTKHKVIDFGEVEYLKSPNTSFLSSVYKINGDSEKNKCIYVDLIIENKPVRIFGTRFSTAINPNLRKKFMLRTIKHKKKGAINIIMGDLNIGTGRLYPFLTGIFRGYCLSELLKNERMIFDSLFRKHDFLNYFSGANTTSFNFLDQQFDHILIPNIKWKQKGFVSDFGFGSDHKILFLGLDSE